ncbi:hypothetical protein, partial [Escherichia coli]|uniref:hypothetical protein n=1 Tax=Escherichia coli TaxID=562 RepID=UPI0019D52456
DVSPVVAKLCTIFVNKMTGRVYDEKGFCLAYEACGAWSWRILHRTGSHRCTPIVRNLGKELLTIFMSVLG